MHKEGESAVELSIGAQLAKIVICTTAGFLATKGAESLFMTVHGRRQAKG